MKAAGDQPNEVTVQLRLEVPSARGCCMRNGQGSDG